MRLRANDNGQTLIALLIFMMLAIMLATTAVAVTIINTQTNSAAYQSGLALSDAESGIENALLRLERDPSYTSETMTMTSGSTTGTVTITISGSPTYTITAVGTVGAYMRTVQAQATAGASGLDVTSWKETP